MDKDKILDWYMKESEGNTKLRDSVGEALYTAIKEGIYQKRQLIINIITIAGAIVGVGLTVSKNTNFVLLSSAVSVFGLMASYGIYSVVTGIEKDIEGHKKQFDMFSKIIDSKRDAALKVVYEQTDKAMEDYMANNQRILKKLETIKTVEKKDHSLYIVTFLFLIMIVLFLFSVAFGNDSKSNYHRENDNRINKYHLK